MFTLLSTCHLPFNPLDADAMLQLAGLKLSQPSTYWDLIQNDTGGWAVANGVCFKCDECSSVISLNAHRHHHLPSPLQP